MPKSSSQSFNWLDETSVPFALCEPLDIPHCVVSEYPCPDIDCECDTHLHYECECPSCGEVEHLYWEEFEEVQLEGKGKTEVSRQYCDECNRPYLAYYREE